MRITLGGAGDMGLGEGFVGWFSLSVFGKAVSALLVGCVEGCIAEVGGCDGGAGMRRFGK